MIIYTNQKSKRKKKKPTAKQRELAAEWQELLNRHQPKKLANQEGSAWTPTKSYVRETTKYPSLPDSGGVATKPIHGKVYTGTAMKGIGTLHKSNAVPIFSDEEAKDQASMRR